MKKLREIHLYLGVLFAPVLLMFAITGAWQMFSLHRAKKDGSYRPPPWLHSLSEVHKSQHVPPTPPRDGTPLRWFMLAATLGLIVTTGLGIVMAYQYGRSKVWVTTWLVAGVVIPTVMLLIFR